MLNKRETGHANPIEPGKNPSLEYMMGPPKLLSMLAYIRIYLGTER